MAKRKNSKHTSLIKQIKNSPSLIGLENIIIAAEEVELWKPNRTGLIGCPDLVMYDNTFYLYGIEVKSTCHPRTIGGLTYQTDRLFKYLKSLDIKRFSVIGAYYDGGYIRHYERRNK